MKKKIIIMTRGVPGCGKSTWANEFVKTNSGYMILSRDDYRECLFGHSARNEYKYSKAKEKAVTEAQINNAAVLLDMEWTKGVIICDTNLNPKTVDKWLLRFDGLFEIEFKDFHVPWTDLLKRNQYRGDKAVPIDVLRHFYTLMEVKNDYVGDPKLPKAVIFDLDGTLANNDHRSPYDLEKCGEDAPNEIVILLLKMLREKGYKFITVSGREGGTKDDITKYRRITQKWVLDHVGETHEHYQRAQGDSRKDDIVKEEIFRQCIADRFNVKLAVDDRDNVVEMWRRIGLECWQVQFGSF